ncbi:ligase-associated DNA damage response endonuclease PdeM [Piscinibacter sakaiensis]|uniref:ligase-associated DNA damage response endonuclease PdeM n=1 Tax=Piscinibacter sakaiensis TaxID=1547922 RepID=UPI003AAA2CE9
MQTARSERADADRTRGRSAAPELVWGGHRLSLLPGKAAWLAERRMLLVADVHIGKAMAFRRAGLPVPHGTSADTLSRLGDLLRQQRATSLVFLGDLLHSADAHAAPTRATLQRWRDEHRDIEMTLVRGNHDDRAGDPVADCNIACVDEPWIVPADADAAGVQQLALCHHPRALPGCQVLAGHLHPAVRLTGGRAHDRLRLPCFHFSGDVGVLPAFGSFTGMHVMRRDTGDRVFAVTDDAVLAL